MRTAGFDPTDDSEQPDAKMERADRAEKVHFALAQLSEEYRSVLVLREIEDCDYETISQMLGIPTGTVRSRLHRARTMLKEYLQKSIGEFGAAQREV